MIQDLKKIYDAYKDREHVYDFMDEVVIQKFDKREGEASDFYEVDKAS